MYISSQILVEKKNKKTQNMLFVFSFYHEIKYIILD